MAISSTMTDARPRATLPARHRAGPNRRAALGLQCDCARTIPRRFAIAAPNRLPAPRASSSSLLMRRPAPAVRRNRRVGSNEH
jgi:hypothetical protein